MARAGKHEAVRPDDEIERLVNEHVGLARAIAAKASARMDHGEALSRCLDGLWNAARLWQDGKGASFKTFAVFKINAKIKDYWKLQRAGRRVAQWDRFSIEDPVGELDGVTLGDRLEDENVDMPFRQLEREDAAIEVSQMLKHLDEVERWVVEHYHGIGVPSRRMWEMAVERGVTESRICQIHKRALKRMEELSSSVLETDSGRHLIPIDEKNSSPGERAILQGWLTGLPIRQRVMVLWRFGLGVKRKTTGEIAEEEGVSQGRVFQILYGAFRDLARIAASSGVKGLEGKRQVMDFICRVCGVEPLRYVRKNSDKGEIDGETEQGSVESKAGGDGGSEFCAEHAAGDGAAFAGGGDGTREDVSADGAAARARSGAGAFSEPPESPPAVRTLPGARPTDRTADGHDTGGEGGASGERVPEVRTAGNAGLAPRTGEGDPRGGMEREERAGDPAGRNGALHALGCGKEAPDRSPADPPAQDGGEGEQERGARIEKGGGKGARQAGEGATGTKGEAVRTIRRELARLEEEFHEKRAALERAIELLEAA